MSTVPLSGTNITFLSGVSLSSDYKHTRWFDSKTDQSNWFNAKPIVYSMSQTNFQRIDGKNFISVDKSIDELWGTNYVMFQNASYNSKWFYAFVTKLEYKQTKTTYVHFQIDVIQTWMFDMNFKASYVVREHQPQFDSNGLPYTYHQEEGLDYGTDYDVVDIQQLQPYSGVLFLVIVSKTALHTDANYNLTQGQISARFNGVPTPLCFYAHPFKMDSPDNYTPIDLSDGTVLSSIQDVLTAIYTNTNAVNDVVGLYITDYLGFDLTVDTTANTIDISPSNVYLTKATITDSSSNSFTTLYYAGDVLYRSKTVDMGQKYTNFIPVNEAKLMMYPYCVISLEDFRGNRVDLKPEYINDSNVKLTVRGGMGTENKVAYTVDSYNTANLPDQSLSPIVSIESGLIDNSANDVPIITDLLSAYMQGNRNTLQNQKNSIIWHGVMGDVGSTISGIGSALTLNPLGVASSITQEVSGTGNTILQLQGIQAKLKDINNTPPQLVKMGSNTAFEYGNKWQGCYVVKRQIKKEYIDKLTDFFNMFGYKSNRVKVPNFHTRQNWNYVQTSSCFITGNFNNDDEQELRNIFDNGITLWHTDDIGNYSLSNGVI